ncbi:MAG: lysine biosynthesis protein LysW [Candidatus Diapherotrites archaeon]
MAECIECGAALALEKVEKGELVECPECGAGLEVVSIEPLKVGLAPKESEDWGE